MASDHSGAIVPTTLTKAIKLISSIPLFMPRNLISCLSILDVPLNLKVPSYIIDEKTLFFLASLIPEQDGTLIGPQRSLVLW